MFDKHNFVVFANVPEEAGILFLKRIHINGWGRPLG
jgi:hypothetical protein